MIFTSSEETETDIDDADNQKVRTLYTHKSVKVVINVVFKKNKVDKRCRGSLRIYQWNISELIWKPVCGIYAKMSWSCEGFSQALQVQALCHFLRNRHYNWYQSRRTVTDWPSWTIPWSPHQLSRCSHWDAWQATSLSSSCTCPHVKKAHYWKHLSSSHLNTGRKQCNRDLSIILSLLWLPVAAGR